MAAIAYPDYQVRPRPARREPAALRPVPRTAARRPTMAAVHRRRRIFVLVVSVAVVGVLAALVRPSPPAAPVPAAVVRGATVVVQPGDTYWSIAEELGGGGDIRDRVQALVEANGGSSSLAVGDRITVAP